MKRATDQAGGFGKRPRRRERITLAALMIGLVASAMLLVLTAVGQCVDCV